MFCHDRLVYHCAIELKHLLITRTGQLKLSNFEYAKHAAWPTMRINTSDVCISESFSIRKNIHSNSFHVFFNVHRNYFLVIEHLMVR